MGGDAFVILTSIGIAMDPSDADHKDDLLAFADAAMHHAKSSGRNIDCFFEASMNAHLHEELQLAQDLTMSVNPSALQFAHANLARTVRDAPKRHAIKPQCLTPEVTESTAMRDADESLRILQQLPASELKIDRGFIREPVRDSEDAAIVSAIVALGRTLNLTIVAEGVETEAQQEFLLGRPMSAENVIAVLGRTNAQIEAP